MPLGIQDLPIAPADESLGLAPYAKALASFIRQCPMPMTIGIQGDWGIGKTSLMTCIQHALSQQAGDACICKTINTWQLSQFDIGDEIALVFIEAVVKRLEEVLNAESTPLERVKRVVAGRRALRAAKILGTVAIAALTKGQGVELEHKVGTREEVGLLEALDDLRAEFARILAEIRSRRDAATRLVFFVDDLDRIQPERAVELLEAMKNFLDVDGAVFVLAVDYEVVRRGLRKKFGEDDGANKGKSFFDKIIQVPFTMPTHAFDYRGFLEKLLRAAGLELATREVEIHFRIIQDCGITNPRAIKRLVNTVLLLKTVFQEEAKPLDAFQLRLLFAVQAIQSSFEPLFKYLAARVAETLKEQQVFDQRALEEHLGEDSPDLDRAGRMLELMRELVDRDGNGAVSPSELDALKGVLKAASLTATDTTAVPTSEITGNKHADAFLRKLPSWQREFAVPVFRFAIAEGHRVRKPNGVDELHTAGIALVFNRGSIEMVTGFTRDDVLGDDRSVVEAIRSLGGPVDVHVTGLENRSGRKPRIRVAVPEGDTEAALLARRVAEMLLGGAARNEQRDDPSIEGEPVPVALKDA